MLAVHLENLLFLLLLVLGGLFQLLGRAARKSTTDEAEPAPKPPAAMAKPIPRAVTESDEERIRKFLEALGQPPTSKPPPPVLSRTEMPPRPLAPVRPPIASWELTREARRKRDIIPKEGPPPAIVRRTEEIAPPKITGAPAFEVHEGPLPIAPPPILQAPAEVPSGTARTIAKREAQKTDIVTLLTSTFGLRDAVILREILGPPRGLRMQMHFSDSIS
jgi:hypothetical protein